MSLTTFTAPAAGLTDAHIAAARSRLDELFGDSWPRVVFIGGSLVAGLGHAWSDIDVYVVDDEGVLRPRAYVDDAMTVQLNVISPEALDLAVQTCTAFATTSADRTQVDQSEDALLVAVRLAIGTVLHDPARIVPESQQRRAALRQLLLCRQ